MIKYLSIVPPHHETTANLPIDVSCLCHPCPQLLFNCPFDPFHSTIGWGVTWQSAYHAALGPQHLYLVDDLLELAIVLSLAPATVLIVLALGHCRAAELGTIIRL
jgi:hypothetical protein